MELCAHLLRARRVHDAAQRMRNGLLSQHSRHRSPTLVQDTVNRYFSSDAHHLSPAEGQEEHGRREDAQIMVWKIQRRGGSYLHTALMEHFSQVWVSNCLWDNWNEAFHCSETLQVSVSCREF